jgi:hypothetical protein
MNNGRYYPVIAGWIEEINDRRHICCRPFGADKMMRSPANPKVGNVKNNDPEILNSA